MAFLPVNEDGSVLFQGREDPLKRAICHKGYENIFSTARIRSRQKIKMTQSASLVRFSELDEEDCSFVLRELELNAFTAVVSAMRAQGVLNNFNECILESLKTALFIPEEVYQAEMRKAANDDFLTRVASILNPSYDTFTAWEMSARQLDVDRPFFPPPKFFDNKGVTTSSLALANDLLALGSSHNEVIAEQDIATARLLSMPKLPYVPERLRKLLKDSESLSSERILPNENDREEEKVVVPPKVVPKKITKVSAILKRKRKVKTNGVRDVSYEEPSTSYSVPEKPAPVSRILSPHTSPTKETASALLNLIPTREAEALGVKEFITKIQAQIEQEARNGLLGDNGKRKRKPRLGTLLKEQYPDCARARPFLFPCRLVDGSKPPRGNPERGTTKRAATPGTSPVMVPPITPPNPNGVLQFTSSVSQGIVTKYLDHPSVGVMNHLPSSSNVLGMSLTPGHKENNSVAIRPAAGTLPLNHVISKPPSVVSPATTPNTGVIKRPRMGSFTDKVSSPIDLTQRAAALRKTYMTPVVNKVKVAVTPPVEVHGQAMPVIPNSKPIYPHTVAVTVNRTQNRTFSTSKDQLRSDPHGHDYVLPKTATIIKKTIIATPGPSPVRALNGVQSLSKAPGQNLAPQTIVREQVVSIVKKASTPPAPSNIPVNLAESKVTPPPTVGSPVQTLAMKKYHAMTSTSSQSQLSAGQFLKKTTPEVTSPPAKRVFYCDPNNPTVATLQPAESLPIKEAPPAGPGPSSVEKPSDGLLPSVSIPVPARISENSDRPDILQQSFGEKIRRTVAAPMLLPLLFATAVALPSGFKTINNGLKGQQLVDFLNQNQGHFKAEFNPMSEEEKKFRVMSISWDALKTAKSQPAPEIATLKDADIPTSFDSRTAWPNCPSISFIRDQAQCGSCWAVASASVISDRTCIASNGANLFTASADDIMSCCTDCGFGCNGGIPLIAMEWWHHTGVVTGGEYHSGEGCKPYPYGYPSYHNETTPQCTSTCQPNYSKSYSEDKHFGGLFYEVPPTVAGIQKEIMTHGPVVACFEEYDDFNYYKTGVYVHTAGDYVGLHCTRVIGWGVENGTPYWLGANSWGRSFGDNGFYKIIRGIDECGYESVMATGRAKA